MAVAIGVVASAAGSVLKSAKKFLAKRAGKLAAKAVQVRQAANMKAGKLDEASSLLNKITGSDVGNVSSNPIKDSGKNLAREVKNIKEKAVREGIILGGKPQGMGMGAVIIGIIAALVLLPNLLKSRK